MCVVCTWWCIGVRKVTDLSLGNIGIYVCGGICGCECSSVKLEMNEVCMHGRA